MGISHVAPRPAAESAGCLPGFHIHVRQAPERGRRVEPALAPEKRGPTQWGGPAESSVPVRARQSAMPETDGRAVVRGKAGFTHDMTFFRHDVRRKRFSTHGKLHSTEITICKDHTAEKPRAGWSLWRHGRPCPCEWVSGDSLTG